jgi:capsule polysaccharide export protein KpsE/RkpR
MPTATHFGSEAGTVEATPDPSATPPTAAELVITTLKKFWAERRFLGTLMIAGLVVSVIVCLILPPQYESTTVLIPSESAGSNPLAMMGGGGSLQNMVAAASNLGDLVGSRTPSAMFVAILRSRTVADRMIDHFDLLKRYHTRSREAARKDLAAQTSIGEDRRNGLLTITVTDSDKYQAAAMAQAYVDELNHLNSELNVGAAHRQRVFLEGRVAQVKTELDDAQKELAAFSSEHGVFSVDEQSKALMETAARLQGQIAAAEAQLDGLEQVYSSSNVRVQEARGRLAGLRQQLAKLRGAPGNADTGSGDLEGFPSLGKLPSLGVTYVDLWRKNKVLNVVFEVLTQQLELARVEEAKEFPTVKVMDPPNIPEYRTRPKRRTIVLFSGLGALLAGMLWILGRDRWAEVDPAHPIKRFLVELAEAVWSSALVLRLRAQVERLGRRSEPS